MKRMPCVLVGSVAALFMLVTAWPASPAKAQETAAKIDPAVRPEFREPVTLASKDGVLEVRLIAKQGTATLDTVAKPVQNMLVFAYELIRGTASDGQNVRRQSLPGADTAGLPRRDADHPSRQRSHRTHHQGFLRSGLHGEGRGGAALPAADDLVATQPAYSWHPCQPEGERRQRAAAHPRREIEHLHLQHSRRACRRAPIGITRHLHTLTAMHVYYGMVGLLAIGRTDGNLPLVTQNQIPVRNMLLQYNYVFDRAGGSAKLNNYTWSQWVNTIKPPQGDALAKGTYRPLLAPVNFLESKKGTEFFTIWYSGPLSIRNERGRFEFIPSNLQRFTALPRRHGKDRAGRSNACPITSATFSSPSTASSSRW